MIKTRLDAIIFVAKYLHSCKSHSRHFGIALRKSIGKHQRSRYSFGSMRRIHHTLLTALTALVGLDLAARLACSATFVGGIGAYIFYEYCHTLAHLSIPKGRFGTWVTRTHLAHHFQDHHATFHVSAGMGWIDQLLGTAFDKARARSRYDAATHQTVGLQPDDPRLVAAREELGLPQHEYRQKG